MHWPQPPLLLVLVLVLVLVDVDVLVLVDVLVAVVVAVVVDPVVAPPEPVVVPAEDDEVDEVLWVLLPAAPPVPVEDVLDPQPAASARTASRPSADHPRKIVSMPEYRAGAPAAATPTGVRPRRAGCGGWRGRVYGAFGAFWTRPTKPSPQ